MARFRHLTRVGLAREDWPLRMQDAWSKARHRHDIFSDDGAGAHWRQPTADSACKALGQFLRVCLEHDMLSNGMITQACTERRNLRLFIIGLIERNLARNTILSIMRHLSAALQAVCPEIDRTTLNRFIALLAARLPETPARRQELRRPDELFDLGLDLMSSWQHRQTSDPRTNAAQFRDGLMIAFLALCPIRPHSLAAVHLDRNIVFVGDRARVVFEPHETKTGRHHEFDWPPELNDALRVYLTEVRPILTTYDVEDRAMWPGKRNRALNTGGIYTAFVKHTEARFGVAMSPQSFRHAAATFIAEMTPDRAMMARAVLQHQGFKMTEKHYIRGQQLKAARMYQETVDDLLRQFENAEEVS